MRDTILITGATGFLGGYLVKRLTKEYRVLALGRNRERAEALQKLGAEFCPGDFTDRKTCETYFRDVRYVIHAGALSTVWGKWEDFYRTNVAGTALVAELCLENGVERLVYISSPSIYTEKHDRYGIREEQAPEQNDLNFYIKSKLMAERVIGEIHEKGLETVILRPRGLIGIGDTSLVPRLLRANGRVGIPLMRDGRITVDLTSVENVAQACRLALTAAEADGKVFNITNGEPTEFRSLLESFLAAVGKQPHYRRLPFKAVYGVAWALERFYRTFRLPGEPPLTKYTVCTLAFSQTMDISRARDILGYKPEKSLMESIQEYGRWWREKEARKERGRTGQLSKKVEPSQELPKPPGMIDVVKLYHCGSCTNDLHLLFRGHPVEKREFPAMAALIRHSRLGNILFDTGYSEAIYQGGPFHKLYRLLNPVHVRPEQVIDKRLKADGINPESIGTIILSHAHPDHIGGLKKFSGYRLVASAGTMKTLDKPGIRDLVFTEMLPGVSDGVSRREAENRLTEYFLCRYFEEVYDLFGDGSLIGVALHGHCTGQMGLWIPDLKLFLAADACWGGDLIRDTLRMRMIPRLIQKDFAEYKDSLRRLCRLKREHPEIRIVFSHQRGSEETYGRPAFRA